MTQSGVASESNVTIRALSDGDKAAWTPLWTGYLAFYETVLPSDMFDLTFARYVDPTRTDMFGFIAEIEGEAVGLAHCICHPHGWSVQDVVYLQDLFTAPQARGHGVARALIAAVYAEADARGMAQTYWTTQSHNYTARALYDQVGVLTPFIKYNRT